MKKILLLFAIGFIFCSSHLTAQSKMAIGYIYEKMSGDCGQFNTAKGYRYQYSSNSSSTLGELRQKVTDDLANYYSLSKNNVMVFTSAKPYGCVISYRKKISGYDCTTFSYAISFGDTDSEARQNAIKEMRLYYNGDSYTVETIVH